MKDSIPGIFYLYLHSKIVENHPHKEAKLKDVSSFLFHWRIPKNIRPLILKELEILGLIERKDKQKIIIKEKQFHEEKIGKFYEELELF